MMLESPSNVIWQVYLWSTLIPLVLNFGNLLLSRWIPAERGVGLSGNDVFLSPWHSDPNSAQSAEICSHTRRYDRITVLPGDAQFRQHNAAYVPILPPSSVIVWRTAKSRFVLTRKS